MLPLPMNGAAASGTRPARHVSSLALLLAIFVASRLFYGLVLGIWMDVGYDRHTLQYLDLAFYRDSFWQTVLYQHSQPPLFSALVAAVEIIFGGAGPAILQGIYMAAGLALMIGLYALMVLSGLPRGLALAVAAVYGASPVAILYESWLFYSYPTAILLLWSAVFALVALQTRRFGAFFGLFLTLGIVALMRPTMHLLWLAALLGYFLAAARGDRRKVLVAAAVPLLLVGALYAKNAALFGTFTASSWMGLNLAKMTSNLLPDEERQRLVDLGVVSPLALLLPFERPTAYRGKIAFPEPTGIPVLDRETWYTPSERFGDPIPNYNHLVLVEASRLRLRDALAIIRHDPWHYLVSVAKSVRIFLRSPIQDDHVSPTNRDRMPGLESFANHALYLQVPVPVLEGMRRLGLGLLAFALEQMSFLVLLQLASFAALAGLLAARLRAGTFWRSPRCVAWGYVLLQVGFLSAIYLLLDNGENYRFRFEMEPLMLAGAVCLAWHLYRLRVSEFVRRRGVPAGADRDATLR
jgi:hypothetical protein